jgi:hypothetical protein
MNYTAEQKQYNNWLTERLLEVAARHNYVFDPEEFNFVAVRDRIRCYYKSYVQTARKRGVMSPSTKKMGSGEKSKDKQQDKKEEQTKDGEEERKDEPEESAMDVEQAEEEEDAKLKEDDDEGSMEVEEGAPAAAE